MLFSRFVGRAFVRGLVSIFFLLASLSVAQAKVVEYTFSIDTLSIEEGGKLIPALAIDGQIPAPLISASRGDILRVTFANRLDEPASIHWHGLLLPSDQDGVPYLNTTPIGVKQQFTFEFPVSQTGTYWYHSHTDFQIQRGVYGSIVFAEPEPSTTGHAAHANGHAAATHLPRDSDSLQEEVVLFSDWSNEPPMEVLANLKKDDDYYAFKKNNVQSWDRVLDAGAPAIAHRLRQSFTRMGPMDLADVAYDAFLANGQRETDISLDNDQAKEVKLRLINGSTSSYFDIEYAGGPMRIIAADGQAVEPILVQRLRMATAETYDVIVPVASNSRFELRATSFDGSGYSSTFVGNGKRIAAPTVPRPNLLLPMHEMTDMPAGHSGHAEAEAAQTMNHVGHAMPGQSPPQTGHRMSRQTTSQDEHAQHADQIAAEPAVIAHLTDYADLRARESTALPSNRTVQTIPLALTGNMQRYVWGFDGRAQREDPRLLITEGDSVRLELSNQTMMHHPIHLHGHFFRVINGQGDRSPLKHTVDVPPMGRVVIEFAATENQDWLFHCHNQYHMKSGMNRVISYVGSSTFDAPIAAAILPARRWYSRNAVRAQRNVLGLDTQLMDERHSFGLEADSALRASDDESELRLSYSYQLTRFAAPFMSAEYRASSAGESDSRLFAGLRLTLPLFIDSEWGIDNEGGARLELGSGLQLTRRLSADWRWNTDEEYRVGVAYNLTKRAALVFGKDSEFGTGLGVSFLF